MNLSRVKIELLCLGAKTEEPLSGIRAVGAGPAGGKYFLLPDGSCVDLPLQNRFAADSPFTLLRRADDWEIIKDGELYTRLKMVPEPKFYAKTTVDGTPMRKIAVLHGRDCLASTVYSKCVYWSLKRQCLFCGIELWRHKQEPPLASKKPSQFAEVAEEAFREGVAKHVTLTTGTPQTPDKGAALLAEATAALKARVNVPVHAQLEPPENPRFLEQLFHAGVDTLGVHVESFDERVLAHVCAMKPRLSVYYRAWKDAVKLFGEGQVSSFILAGLGENDASILNGVESLSSMGVVSYLLPLRPVIGTALEKSTPPPPERMVRLYAQTCEAMRKYGLDPTASKAGCVRCGACSALNEVFKNTACS